MIRVGIIGSNDLGKLIAYHAIEAGWNVVGFFDNRKEIGVKVDAFGQVLGNVDMVDDVFDKNGFDCLMVGVGYTQFPYRKFIFEKFKGKIPFGNLIHKSSHVDRSVILGEGVFILPGCVVDMAVQIGDNVLLNVGCTIAHHSYIKNHCFVAPAVNIAGNVTINESCFLGVGSTILDTLSVASNSVIGGGAVVIETISEPGVYVGVPAKKIKKN